MAMEFSGAAKSVNYGSGSSLDDLVEATIVAMIKPHPTLLFNDCRIYNKGDTTLWFTLNIPTVANSNLQFTRDRATTDLNVQSGVGTGPKPDIWSICAVTFNTGGGNPAQKIYMGTPFQPVKELAYAAQTVGSGAVVSDAAQSVDVGNRSGGSRDFGGDIAWIGVYARHLTPAMVEGLRRNLQPIPGCVLFSHLGYESAATIQLDWSGWGNHGTPVSSPGRTAHPAFLKPIPGYRKVDRIWYPIVDAVAGGGIIGRSLIEGSIDRSLIAGAA